MRTDMLCGKEPRQENEVSEAARLESQLRLAKSLLARHKEMTRSASALRSQERAVRPLMPEAAQLGCPAALKEQAPHSFDGIRARESLIEVKGGSLLQKTLCVMAAACEGRGTVAFLHARVPLASADTLAFAKSIKELEKRHCVPALAITGLKRRELSQGELSGLKDLLWLRNEIGSGLIWFTDAGDPKKEPDLGKPDLIWKVHAPKGSDDLKALLEKLLQSAGYENFFAPKQLDKLVSAARDQGEIALIAQLAAQYGGLKNGSAALTRALLRLLPRLRAEGDPVSLALTAAGMFFTKSETCCGALCFKSPLERDQDEGHDLHWSDFMTGNTSDKEDGAKNCGRVWVKPKEDSYDERLVCSKDSVAEFISVMKALSDCKKRGENLDPHAGTALLWGPPGTGKTDFARHLGDALGRETRIVTGAELLAKYCGETEKLISDLFDEAAKTGTLLVIDEVDYLLRDRGRLHQGWEASMVDQFLSCMNDYQGLLVGTTNNQEIIDPAVRRRFTYEFEFTYANDDQKLLLWDKYLMPCAAAPLSKTELARLLALKRLTPGDFLNIKNRHNPRYAKEKPPAAQLLDELGKAAAFRENGRSDDDDLRRRIGFV